MRTLNYCLINSGLPAERGLPMGVEQWVGALGGQRVEPEALALPGACERYDIVQLVWCPQNARLVADIRSRLGAHSRTRLVVSLPSIFEASYEPHEIDVLAATCAHADLLTASDPASAQHYERLLGQPVNTLAHPADLDGDNAGAHDTRLDQIAFVMSRARFDDLNREFMGLPAQEGSTRLQGREIEVFGDDFCSSPVRLQRLSRYAFICFDADLEGHDAELLYLARRGCVILGGGRAEIIKRCYALTAHRDFPETLKSLIWLLSDDAAKNFALECAADKCEYYNHGNSRNRLLNLLAPADATLCEALPACPPARASGNVVFLDAIHRVSGPAHFAYADNEFMVVCLVKNGIEYLPSFLRHYRAMGARHFCFIDNESTDDTREVLAHEPDVTTYRTALKHKKFESEIRRVIIERHCRSRWCMCVDIDELFEFPGADVITSRGFLDYLNVNWFTSVVSYMLDMFAQEPHAAAPYLEDAYPNFDLSNITRGDYFAGFEAFCDRNVLQEPGIGNYYGGVRQHYIRSGESKFLLTKHPLVFIDHRIEAVTMPHFCNNARVADVTCLLKHYKLTVSLRARIEEGVETDTFAFIIKDQIAAYISLFSNEAAFGHAGTAEAYVDVEHFVRRGFLHTSERYRNYIARASHGTNRGFTLDASQTDRTPP
jgi:hypothetical protein